MQDHNFLPLWYRNKIEKKKRIKFRIYMCIMCFIIVVGSARLFKYEKEFKRLRNMNDLKSNKTLKNEDKINETQVMKYDTINAFNSLKKYVQDKIVFDSLEISGEEICVENSFNNIKAARKMIESIEKGKSYRIKSIDIQNINENKIVTKIELEVKDDE
ncbi:hypothetical protein [Clostridium sp.]|jgi:hypothetical protein|uniref:hypothetical protein n=1 Tax=Clostridium sp. TaxID=1506 RepID=UPI0039F484E4